ncbi:MAG: hypothetical protein LBG72_04985 [Spirochaetaceae bacterium]|jgi:hypothetical protein|nr:hypothetical protein [Spirochaetaceae bacterium]
MKPVLVVLAAGMGSRYGGVKQIDGVGRQGETLLDYATYDAKRSGYGSVVYIIRKDIEAAFRERIFDRVAKNFDASYVFQSRESLLSASQIEASKNRTKPWGTIHALLCAKDVVKAPFTVINADDYYGRAAFGTLGGYLAGIDLRSTEHAMVGYVLKSTMSRSGTVSRGICDVKGGFLVTMREHKKIGYDAANKIVSEGAGEGGGNIMLTGEEPVSMNFFGFSTAIFDEFTGFFDEFIKRNAMDEKAECLLPDAAGKMVAEGRGKIKVFESRDSWFGMTYPEDRAIVRAEINKKIEDGYYPERLWEE